MPPKHQHPDAHHAYLYPAKSPANAHDKELEAWLDHALGAKVPDPMPDLHDV